jgi:GNAT superfamily N-acetyltransferase
VIRDCGPSDVDDIHDVINDGASAYRGIIAPDCWHEPYMPREELAAELAAGVRFAGYYDDDETLAGVMGLQDVKEVALIRHAYTRTSKQRRGIGAALLAQMRSRTSRPVLLGTWRAAAWAIRFYEGHGFRLLPREQTPGLLRRYWKIPERQLDESVVMADAAWFAGTSR